MTDRDSHYNDDASGNQEHDHDHEHDASWNPTDSSMNNYNDDHSSPEVFHETTIQFI
jgi:hypothetical protein